MTSWWLQYKSIATTHQATVKGVIGYVSSFTPSGIQCVCVEEQGLECLVQSELGFKHLFPFPLVCGCLRGFLRGHVHTLQTFHGLAFPILCGYLSCTFAHSTSGTELIQRIFGLCGISFKKMASSQFHDFWPHVKPFQITSFVEEKERQWVNGVQKGRWRRGNH